MPVEILISTVFLHPISDRKRSTGLQLQPSRQSHKALEVYNLHPPDKTAA